MAKNIKTHKKVNPMIYAYIIPALYNPEDPEIKVGYTEKDPDERIAEQFGQTKAVVHWRKKWDGPALFDDNGEPFKDHALHAYFAKNSIERLKGSEWFKMDHIKSKKLYEEFKKNHGILEKLDTLDYKLREEQEKAVEETVKYYLDPSTDTIESENGEFLWNAKPRFGKTLTTYDFCKKVNAKSILILTNRPAIAASWYSDYEKFIGTKDGYYFVSSTDTLKDKSKFPYVISREEFISLQGKSPEGIELGHIDFISLQDLKGSEFFGGDYKKLDYIADLGKPWDVVVLDEAHEGIDTTKSDFALSKIKRKFTLHLSGTPFKAIKNEKFEENAIFNWTYVDEQTKKRDWAITHPEENNPYEDMPQLNLFTYQMSSIIEDKVDRGIDIDGETRAFAFDLNEFFATTKEGDKFIHDEEVDKFLDALTTQSKFPFSTPELRDELKHTFWILNRVNSAKCLEAKLSKHPVFKDYKIILAAGDGTKLPKEEDEEIDKLDEKKNDAALNRVKDAIKDNDKTITLSVGQLTTGITVPEWTAVLMLSNMSSESLYVQAAFRAQNPCLFKDKDGNYYRKENAYVFDFDPARTLTIYESFAKSTASDTSVTTAERNHHVKELLNFLPVIGEDDEGEMIELDAEKVLSIPRKIHAQEVVKHGFMSNFLFKNISNVFLNPALLGITSKIPQAKEQGTKKIEDPDKKKLADLKIDENGEPIIDEEKTIGLYTDKFGDKLYKVKDAVKEEVEELEISSDKEARNKEKEELVKSINKKINEEIFNNSDYLKQEGITNKQQESLKRITEATVNDKVDRVYKEYISKNAELEKKSEEILKACSSEAEKEFVKKELEEDKKKNQEELKENIKKSVETIYKDTGKQIVETVEKKKKKKEIADAEKSIKDHLRGFSRTIPSFLMAYGDNTTTLDNFDKIVSDEVFEEVTKDLNTGKYISLDEFRLLRDGGTYIDEETKEEQILEEGVFDEKVFDSSIKEFLNKRIELADYFDETKKEDIFDYIPPQRTNQIFTPKDVVINMEDLLEQENAGCFDNPNFTFFDPYMKSGQFITEIVKRLYRSEKMKKIFPDDKERLLHIFENQVYGCAPTEIIFAISLNYIVGFINSDSGIKIDLSEIKHNFLLLDTLPIASDGTMETEIFKQFNDTTNRVNLKDYVKILYKSDAYNDLTGSDDTLTKDSFGIVTKL